MTDTPIKLIRNLTLGLIISGTLNIVLATSFFYWAVKDRPPTPYFELKPANQIDQRAPLASDQSNSELIRTFKTMSIEQLTTKLSNTQLVENGYTQRDLALAALVTFHHFDISRALLGMPQPEQQRTISYGIRPDGTHAELTIFPGLTQQQFDAVIHFGQTERWPLTSKGLFIKVRKQKQDIDPSLLDAFFLTPEFLAVEMLFNRAEVSVEKSELLAVIKQGNWPMLSKFCEEQRQSQDLSAARRQAFLLEFIEKDSKAAAYLMLKTDGAYAVRKLDDKYILIMLELLSVKSLQAEQFATALLTSPRSDAVWTKAARRLYEYTGEPIPEKFQHHAAIARFLPETQVMTKSEPVSIPMPKPIIESIPQPVREAVSSVRIETKPNLPPKGRRVYPPEQPSVKNIVSIPVKRERVHIVQDGDSLWKISKRYKVDVERIKSYNRLEGDFLKPGTTLRIPL